MVQAGGPMIAVMSSEDRLQWAFIFLIILVLLAVAVKIDRIDERDRHNR